MIKILWYKIPSVILQPLVDKCTKWCKEYYRWLKNHLLNLGLLALALYLFDKNFSVADANIVLMYSMLRFIKFLNLGK